MRLALYGASQGRDLAVERLVRVARLTMI